MCLKLFTFCKYEMLHCKRKKDEGPQSFSKVSLKSVAHDLSASAFCMHFLCFLILFCIETDNDDL